METETNDFAERMVRAAAAFRLVVLEKKSLRAAAEALGVSHVTVARDVKAYSTHLAEQRGKETIDERRAAFVASLDDVYRMALEIFAYAMQNRDTAGKKLPLAATAALNTIAGLQTHYRAVGALDAAKEIRQDVDQRITIVWGDDEDDDKDYAASSQYPND